MNMDDERSYQRVIASLLGGIVANAMSQHFSLPDWRERTREVTNMRITEVMDILSTKGLTDTVKSFVEYSVEKLLTDETLDSIRALLVEAAERVIAEGVDTSDPKDILNFSKRFNKTR